MATTHHVIGSPLAPPAGWRSVGLVRQDAQARDALAARLAAMRGWKLVFSVGSVQEALAGLERSAPSVLLVDLGLPGGEALEVLRTAGHHWPGCVAIAICDDDAAVQSLRLPEPQAWGQARSGAPAEGSLIARTSQ